MSKWSYIEDDCYFVTYGWTPKEILELLKQLNYPIGSEPNHYNIYIKKVEECPLNEWNTDLLYKISFGEEGFRGMDRKDCFERFGDFFDNIKQIFFDSEEKQQFLVERHIAVSFNLSYSETLCFQTSSYYRLVCVSHTVNKEKFNIGKYGFATIYF